MSPWLQERRVAALQDLRSILQRAAEFLPRDDYRELAELSMLVLGETPPRGVHISIPGALHNARFMARMIYSTKMYLFRAQLMYQEETVNLLEPLVIFYAIFYVPFWFKCRKACDAPANDLKFMKDMMVLEAHLPDVAKVAKEKMESHTWYLTQQITAFAVFDNVTCERDKEDIARKILSQLHTAQKDLKLGKPQMPKVSEDTTLLSLIGPASYLIFERLNIGSKWLEKPVQEWKHDTEYMKGWNIVREFQVTNDIAERGIKMMTDFANSTTKDVIEKQKVYQSVEYHRLTYKNYKNSTLIP